MSVGALKSSVIFLRIQRAIGLCTCSGKTREGPKLAPVADLEALHNQEVKNKAELSTCFEYWRFAPNSDIVTNTRKKVLINNPDCTLKKQKSKLKSSRKKKTVKVRRKQKIGKQKKNFKVQKFVL